MAAKSAFGKLWGPVPEAIKWIYEAMVKPIILYGSVVWAHKIPKNFAPLKRIQRLAMLCTGSYPRSTRTYGLEIIRVYIPLDIQAKLEATKAAARIHGHNPRRWDGIGDSNRRGHLFHFDRDWGNLDRKQKIYHWRNRPTIDWDSFLDGNPTTQKGIQCYMDGSQLELEDGSLSDVGIGFVIRHTDKTTTKF